MKNRNKSSELFKQVIERQLTEMGENDELFARNLLKADKNMDDCINYILTQVQKSGICGFTDDEVFGMAAYYYEEDLIEKGAHVKCEIVMNHTVQLSEQEINDAKKEAIEREISTQRAKLHQKKAPVTVPAKPAEVLTQTSLF